MDGDASDDFPEKIKDDALQKTGYDVEFQRSS